MKYEMYIMSKQEIVDVAIDNFIKSRENCNQLEHPKWKPRIEALKKLENPTAEQINEIIGNDSWTENKCTHCGDDCQHLVHFGNEVGYDVIWQRLCIECLTEGIDTIQKAYCSKENNQ